MSKRQCSRPRKKDGGKTATCPGWGIGASFNRMILAFLVALTESRSLAGDVPSADGSTDGFPGLRIGSVSTAVDFSVRRPGMTLGVDSTEAFPGPRPGVPVLRGDLYRGVFPRLRLGSIPRGNSGENFPGLRPGAIPRGCSAPGPLTRDRARSPGPLRLPGGSLPPYPQQPWSGRRGEPARMARSVRRPACLWQDGRVVVPSGQGSGGGRSRSVGRTTNCGLRAGMCTNEKRNGGGIGRLGQSRAQRPNCV